MITRDVERLYSSMRFIGDGTTKVVPLTFDLNSGDGLAVDFGEGLVTSGYLIDYDVTPATVLFTDPLPLGKTITIRRLTKIDKVKHIFQWTGNAQGGADFSAKNVDENFEQITRASQDAMDSQTLATETLEEMAGIRDTAIDARDKAKVSEVNAKASETASKASETNAKTSETKAKDSEGMAYKWANNPHSVPVEGNEYSAYHWAKEAEDSAGGLTPSVVEELNKKADKVDVNNSLDGKLDKEDVVNEWGDREYCAYSVNFLNTKLFDNYETLEDARNSVSNSPYIYIKQHSVGRKTGGGLYCRTDANLTDNNGSRIVTASGVSYEIEPSRREYAETFGVVGDNTTDNMAHLQNMLDYIGQSVAFHRRVVRFGAGSFVLNDDIQIPKALLNLQFIGVGGMACRLVYKGVDKETAVLNVEAEMFKIRGVRLTYLNTRPNSNQIKKIGLNFFRQQGDTIDIDCEIEDIYIVGFNVAVKHTGRGLWLHNSTIAQCVNVLELDFPNKEDIAPTTGTAVSGLYENAWRAIRVNDCRFHSITQQAVKNTGSNAHILNGFQMTDCLNDIGNGWFNGHLGVNALITNLQTLNGGDYTQMILTGGIAFTIDGILSNYSVDRSLPANTINMNGVFKGVMSNLNLGGGSSHVIRADLRDSDIKFSNVVMHSLNTGTVYGMYFNTLNNSTVEVVEASVLGRGSAVVAVRDFVESDLKCNQLSGANTTLVSVNGVDLGFAGLSVRGGSLIPNTRGSLGLSNRPFDNLYVTNQPVVVSDARKKNNIKNIDEVYLKIIAELDFKQFTFKDAQIHFGIIAQDWIELCVKYNVDPYESGVLVGSEEEGYAVRYGELQNLFNAYILTKLK